MTIKIKDLRIRAFRGIRELRIPFERKSLLLLGENGTGKSSIVEALEFFFTGSIERLVGEGTQGLSISRHATHILHDETDTEIVLTFDPGGVEVKRSLHDEPEFPDSLASYFRGAQNGTFVLRRSQLLDFIATLPSKRYLALASLIGIEGIDDIELEMKRLQDEYAGQVDSFKDAIKSIKEELEKDLGIPDFDEQSVISSINANLKAIDLPTISSLDETSTYSGEVLQRLLGGEGTEKLLRINSLIEETSAPPFKEEIHQSIADAEHNLNELLAENAKRKIELVEFLRTGKQELEIDSPDTCPFCGQKIDREALIENVERRIQTLSALSGRASDIRKSVGSMIATVRREDGRLHSLSQNLGKIEEFGDYLPIIAQARESLALTIKQLEQAQALQAPLPSSDIEEEFDAVKKLWHDIDKVLNAFVASKGLTDRNQEVLDAIRLVDSVSKKLGQVSKEESKLAVESLKHRVASEIAVTYEDSKKEIVTGIYDDIQADVQSYYELLHPGEAHGTIRLLLDPARRASTLLRMNSYGKGDEDPRAYSSEGHLDSLGLCIYLAFVKSFSEECSLIVLDDVVTTIDAGHRRRIGDLLFEEFSNWQHIITTHDDLWFEELRLCQRANGVSGSSLNLQVTGWSLEDGVDIDQFEPLPEEIESKIDSNDKSGASNGSRTYLEWILKEIIVQTDAPISVSAWTTATVGTLLPPARNRLRGKIQEREYLEKIESAFSNLEATSLCSNLLSHDNPEAKNLSREEIREFFEAVRSLHHIVSCHSCGEFLTYVRDVQEYRCKNRKCDKQLIVKTT